MSRDVVRVGVLFSSTGSYAAVGRAMRAGAELAIAEVNEDTTRPIRLEPIAVDPGGVTEAYAAGVRRLLAEDGLAHVFGCYTSSSRKEVLPLFDKHDALLWYPSHYEGFETSDNVICSGAAPNQHIVPLARYLLAHHGRRGWFIGSNYVWAWENNRILREALTLAGGTVLGERYFPVGETDLNSVADQILRDRPDFVFMTLIGESAFAFLRGLRKAADRVGLDQARNLPVASCSLSEAELPFLGGAAGGHLSSSVYFSTIPSNENKRFTPSNENKRFTRSWNCRFRHLGPACADAEATYVAVHLLAAAAEAAGGADAPSVRGAVRGLSFAAPQGRVTVDAENLHCWMRPRIGRPTEVGTFGLVFEEAVPVRPDPYLVWSDPLRRPAAQGTAHLKVVP